MKTLITCWIAIEVLSPTGLIKAQAPPVALDSCASAKPIVSKASKDAVIVLLNEHGTFTAGDNTFCLQFRKTGAGESVDIRGVNVDFSQLVGRIQERSIIAQLNQDGIGKYVGHVDLGRQFYNPAAYYVAVHYFDANGKKRKVRVLLAVK
jgi:hypothetical protein